MDTLISLFLELLKVSLTAGIVAGVVLLVRLLIGKKLPRKVCYALWGLVLVRLALPFSLTSPVSIFTPTPYTPQNTVAQDLRESDAPRTNFPANSFLPDEPEAPAAEAPSPETSREEPLLPEESAPEAPAAESSPAGEPAAPAVPDEESAAAYGPWPAVLAAVWLAGAALLILGGAGSYLVLLRRYRTACLLPDQSLFDRCNAMLQRPFRRRVGLYRSRHAASPLVIGLLRPRIILPEEDIPEEQAVCIVMHELLHIRRVDHLVRLISLLAAAIHWFNPMIWLALRFSAKDMELSCDEAALSRLGEERSRTYATALLELSVRQRRGVSPLLTFGESNLKTRVKNALTYRKPTFWISAAAVLVVAAGAVFLLTDPIRQPVIEAGDALTADLAGMPLQLTADEELAALLNPENWEEADAAPQMDEFSSVRVAAGDRTFAFSQTDPVATLTENGEETVYRVPLGTEETLRAGLLEQSAEFAALPEAQREILSALVNAETLWGMRDYADYFAVRPEFISKLSAAILANPGEEVSGAEPDSEQPADYMYIHLVNPRSSALLTLWRQGNAAVLSMGELQVSLPADGFSGLFEEFQASPRQGWSTDMANPDAPGFTALPQPLPAWGGSIAMLAGDSLAVIGSDGYDAPLLLTVQDLSAGEIAYREEAPAALSGYRYDVLSRPAWDSRYGAEITGYIRIANGNDSFFTWSVPFEAGTPSSFRSDWPAPYDPLAPSARRADAALTDAGDVFTYYDNGVLWFSENGGDPQTLISDDDIRAAFAGQGLMIGDYSGLQEVSLLNGGNTAAAEIATGNYPFTNGLVLAARDGDGWRTRVHTGSAYYAEGGLQNAFYRILDDGTIAYYLLEDAGWTAELIDPETLETIRTLDFGGYSPDYLSLEGMYPLSISGDAFYSPRVVIRLLDRNTAAVTDRCYKLNGQRLYFLDFEENLLSAPVELNGALTEVSREWIVTCEIPPEEQESPAPRTLYCRPAGEILSTLGSSELRPLLPKEEKEPLTLDESLLELFNAPVYLTSRMGEGAYGTYSDQIYSSAFNPVLWTPCAQPPELPAKPDATAENIAHQSGLYAAANFYQQDSDVFLELLPKDAEAAPAYYSASANDAGWIGENVESYGSPAIYPENYTGSDADRRIFEAENRLDILDAAALLEGGTRRRYDTREATVLALEGDTAVCLAAESPAGSYAERRAAAGLVPAGVRSLEAGGRTFYEWDGARLVVFTAGETPSAVSLSDGYAAGLIGAETLAAAWEQAAQQSPRLYRDETTFRVQQLLDHMAVTHLDTGQPAAMFQNQFFYRFAELMADYRASDEWDAWTETVSSFLASHQEDYAYLEEDPELPLTIFLPGEVFRAAIRDAWGSAAQPYWEQSGNLLSYYPEEDLVSTAYGIGFTSSSRTYPVTLSEENGRLTVQYAILAWFAGEDTPYAIQNGEPVQLGESWPRDLTLEEVRRRQDELPLQTAEFVREDGRWIFAPGSRPLR